MSLNTVNQMLNEIVGKKSYSVNFAKAGHVQEIIISSKKQCLEFSSVGDEFSISGSVTRFKATRQELKDLLLPVIGKYLTSEFLG